MLTFDFRFLLKVVDQNSGDAMFQYNCCLIWCGLLHIVHTDRNDTITDRETTRIKLKFRHSEVLE